MLHARQWRQYYESDFALFFRWLLIEINNVSIVGSCEYILYVNININVLVSCVVGQGDVNECSFELTVLVMMLGIYPSD